MSERDEREIRLGEARRLSQLLICVAEQAKAGFAAAVAPFGLPVPLARAFLTLGSSAPMRDLADRLACDRSYVTSLADQLEERGLVARVPGDDRRVKLLALTEAGEELRDRMSTALAEQALVLRRLDDADRAALAPLLEKLVGDDEAGAPAGW